MKALGSFQGALGHHNKLVKQLKEHKRKTTLLNSNIMKPKGSGNGKGKPGTKDWEAE